MISFIIPGKPFGKQRPRHGKGITYTPEETVNYENWVKHCFLDSKCQKLEGEIRAIITAYYLIPKSASKKKKEKMLNNDIRPTKKPDSDNIAKSVLDSLNNIAFDDDSQIVSLQVEKYYSDEPRVEVFMEVLNG